MAPWLLYSGGLMFLWITGSLDLSKAGQFDAVENMGEAGFAGRHLVVGDRGALDLITSDNRLSRKAMAYYKSVKAKYSQIAVLRGFIPKVNVSADCYSPLKGDEWTVPLDSFRTDDAVEKALVIVEHMYDYKVISGLASAYLRGLGAGGWVGVSLTPVSGGGGGSSLTLSVHQNNKRSLGICVVDSDRPHIRGPLGSTARGCAKIYDDRWGWRLHVINARELENIVPPEIYEAGGIDYKLGSWGSYRSETWAIHGFADTKKGDCLCRFRALGPGDQSYRETVAALQEFPVVNDHECPSPSCSLCEADESVLVMLSSKIETHPLAGLRKLPAHVSALSDLLREFVSYGAAPKWSMI